MYRMTHPNIEWFETLDYTEFYNDIKKVEKTILQDQVNNGTEHFLHFKKIQKSPLNLVSFVQKSCF